MPKKTWQKFRQNNMDSIFNSQTLQINCPGCGKLNEKTVGWLRSNSTFPCAGCKVEIEINSEDFDNKLIEADGVIDDFIQKINKIN